MYRPLLHHCFDDDMIERITASAWWRAHVRDFSGPVMDATQRFLDGCAERVEAGKVTEYKPDPIGIGKNIKRLCSREVKLIRENKNNFRNKIMINAVTDAVIRHIILYKSLFSTFKVELNKLILRSIVIYIFFLVFTVRAGASEPRECSAQTSAELNKLESVYTLGEIRVFWTVMASERGPDHRLPEQSLADANGNAVPDFIENVARQAVAAREAFVDLGFRDPLDSPKYRDVRFIDINILRMNYNGSAYDSAIYYPAATARGEDCTLRIDISSQLETRLIGPPGNQRLSEFTANWFVVAHEMFHLFQYGLTEFKRSWLNEPTAKWAEYALRRGEFYPLGAAPYTIPATQEEIERDIIGKPIDAPANRFWTRLIELAETDADRQTPAKQLLPLAYTDGRPIFKDDTLRGTPFIVALFEALNALDKAVSRSEGWSPYRWRESDQISATHDLRLLRLVHDIVRDRTGHHPELEPLLGPN